MYGRLVGKLYSGLDLTRDKIELVENKLFENIDKYIRYNPTFKKTFGSIVATVGSIEFCSTWYNAITSGKPVGPIANYLLNNDYIWGTNSSLPPLVQVIGMLGTWYFYFLSATPGTISYGILNVLEGRNLSKNKKVLKQKKEN